ncbi:MAG: cytidine deaminase [Caldilineales bacterium]|nr:cytidine deaminase [Caldilineales bacterium]
MTLTAGEEAALVQAAMQARKQAYAPYSRYTVGAAVLTATGKVFSGCNIENAVYPATCCAERVTIFKAVSEGERRLRALAVVTHNGGSPCGICRQVMREFAPDLLVLIADAAGHVRRLTLPDLLPDSFGPEDIGYVTGAEG